MTGSVSKGQGRNQHKLLTHSYWEFVIKSKIAMIYPQHDKLSQTSLHLLMKDILVDFVSVVRVWPRTSKAIEDLILPH